MKLQPNTPSFPAGMPQATQTPEMTPMQRRTVLANNAIDALKQFYADALGENLEQNQRNAMILKQMGEQLRSNVSTTKQLKEKDAMLNEASAMLSKAEGLFDGVKALADSGVAPTPLLLKKLLAQYENDGSDGAVDNVEPPVGEARQG
jgi:hypothetical protein